MKRRSFLMSGSSAIFSTLLPFESSFAQGDATLKRPPLADEDRTFHFFTQSGLSTPTSTAVVIRHDGVDLIVHYPLNSYTGRLLVFSHGAVGDPRSYRGLIDHLVSHGFVVVAPVHEDSVLQRGLLTRRPDASGIGTWEFGSILNDTDIWLNRIRSCQLALDIHSLIGETVGIIVEADRPIIIGHDLGAFVVAAQLGAKINQDGTDVRLEPDPRWYAGVMLSPQGSGIMGLTDDSWSAITRPLMVVQGGKDADFTLQDPVKKIDAFNKSAPGNKHLAWFPDGDRLMYLNSGTVFKENNINENVRAVLTVFCDAYGNYNQESFNLISTNWFDHVSKNKIRTAYR